MVVVVGDVVGRRYILIIYIIRAEILVL